MLAYRECIALILAVSCSTLVVASEPEEREKEYIHFSESSSWKRLLHYYPAQFSGHKSSVDSAHFFVSPHGKYDPYKELQANLRFNEIDSTYICKFPARYESLCKLQRKTCKDPVEDCKALSEFVKPHLHSRLSLIFASAFLKNPASMFGHTFLRLDNSLRQEPSPLLEKSINFAARTNSEKGLVFAFKGLTGGFYGSYGMQSFTKYVEEYTENENRDLWEYHLDLQSNEVRRLLLHLWELRDVHFDYYFLDENCSSQLLSLIESAKPELRLSDYSKAFTLPTDTIRTVRSTKNLVSGTTYRPSKTSILRLHQEQMSSKDITLAKAVTTGEIPSASLRATLSKERRIQILDLAIDALSREEDDTFMTQILLERSTLGIEKRNSHDKQIVSDPSLGHSPHRFNFQVGAQQNRFFIEPEVRFLYHDDTDPSPGYLPGSSLEVLKTSFRYYPNEDAVYFEKVQPIRISSLPIRDTFLKPFSWEVSIQGERRIFENRRRALVTSGRAMGGIHYSILNDLSLITLFGSEIVSSGRFQSNFNIAPISQAELKFHFAPPFHMRSSAVGKTYLLESSIITSYSLTTSFGIDLSKKLQVHFEYKREQEFADPFNNYQISLRAYF